MQPVNSVTCTYKKRYLQKPKNYQQTEIDRDRLMFFNDAGLNI